MLWHFQSFREHNTAYGTECFNKVCQFSLPFSLAKFGGPRKWLSLSSGNAPSFLRICFRIVHWNCEPKRDSVNLQVINLKNNKADVLCWVAVSEAFRKYVKSPNLFCYVCAEFTRSQQRKSTTPIAKKAYELYFGCKFGDQDKSWTPHSCCSRCSRYYRGCLKADSHIACRSHAMPCR